MPRKSRSDLELETSDPFLKEAIENLNKHREEQVRLENQLLDLMAKSKQRRKDFKAVWGVSPRSINQKRTVKTVLNVQTCKVNDGHDDPSSEPFNPPVMPEDRLQNHDDEAGDEECQALDVSISTDLFGQLIDANFTPPRPEPDDLHNFTDLSLTAPTKVAGAADDRVVRICGSGDLVLPVHLGQPRSRPTNLANCPDVDVEPIDMELESQHDLEPKKSVRFLNATPEVSTKDQENVVDHFKYKAILDIESPVTSGGPVPTPVALRNISIRAQQELELLYQDEHPLDQHLEVSF